MKLRRCIYGAVFYIGIIMFFACENDLRKVEQISAKKMLVPVDKSTGVEIIYSDSAIVKAKLITPELLNFKTEKPYIEMNKGVTVIFYDQNQQESSRVKADYAIRRERENIVELKRNVVATNIKGETFKSDELIWDETKRRFYSNKLVSITSNQNILHGTSFWANEDFSYYEIVQSTGDLRLTGEQGF
ncbi:LPS export ABC transporter periplasmic protein LptC [Daejeonella sp.]|uniref:LPS export ABC transporter periplasmic protein LptC n=1 Tax=Daejeonella sp. TaxID=2805397 RepID=UPI002CF18793|nr:LPS export ABC transporter periplasmic protein LptC [Daejeonella sp.]HQT24953.1 LPS export ABC transporter periplasmic protein LptC [Daejeonella sp.]HQT59515.1 LPS export ABC transporter periplasmic protein LptC [Daejeonella sp.]